MPILPIDYNKCVIYKLCCSDINVTDVYVGHTTDIVRRKSKHKHSCNNQNSESYNYKVYQFIRANGGFQNWSMIEIEKIPCLDSQEACKRERYWVENLRATLNSNIPSRGKKEYEQEYNKEYNKQNAETIKEKKCIYYQNNIEKFTKKNNEYQATNNAKLKKKIECPCGGRYQHTHKSQHLKTKKHMSYCSQIN